MVLHKGYLAQRDRYGRWEVYSPDGIVYIQQSGGTNREIKKAIDDYIEGGQLMEQRLTDSYLANLTELVRENAGQNIEEWDSTLYALEELTAYRACFPLERAQEVASGCSWTQDSDPDSDTYQCSDCGTMWTFIDGDPIKNHMKFCPGCGRPVMGVYHLEYNMDEDADEAYVLVLEEAATQQGGDGDV